MPKILKQPPYMEILFSEVISKCKIPPHFGKNGASQARRFHEMLEAYNKTPLVALDGLAKKLDVKKILVKDESKRFGLNSFKGLGGSFAMFQILCRVLGLDPEKAELADLLTPDAREKTKNTVFVTATDGNHGKGVAWAGSLFGCKVHVYMPAGSAEVRAEAIRRYGQTEVTITDLNYDNAVLLAKEQSEKYGWHLIQDTSHEGCEEIPTKIVQGYLTLAEETVAELDRLKTLPTHLFLQAGVGAMAGGVLAYFADRYGKDKPLCAIVEPKEANCIFLSALAADGTPRSVEGDPQTIMAGLNCGTPCGVTWDILRDYAEFYLSCDDTLSAEGMRTYAANGIISGESGAATLGVLEFVLLHPNLREKLGLNENSVIVLINTEGNTDPQNYEDIVFGGKFPLQSDAGR